MKYDAIVIGTGQASPSLATTLAGKGLKTAVIEKGNYGGSCVNVGCTPTKAYVASARRAFTAKDSSDHGVKIDGKVHIDLKKIKGRKDKLVLDSRTGLGKMLENTENLTAYHGKARLTGPTAVDVNGSELKADKIFLNVGAKPRIPDGFGQVDYLTNASILELEEIPDHLIIIGGGYIGLEFGQIFKRFGSEVTIIERGDRLLKQEDDDISEAISDVFRNEGINVRFNTECTGAKSENGSVTVSLDCNKGNETVSGSHLLLATGRIPNTDDLGLEKAGVKTDEKGFIEVNDHLETNVSGVYALGDCNGKGAFTHTAYNDFQIAASHLFDNGKRKLSDRYRCYAVYIDPAFARVGLSEKEVKEQGIHAKIARWPMSRIARAREMGETQGFLKIIISSETDKILGASFLGAGADEYIHTIIDLMYADAPYTVVRDAVHIHPTVSELIPTMLENIEELK